MFIKLSSISEFRSQFFEWGKSRNWPKSGNDVTYTNFNCKTVEVTEVVEKVNSKKSGRTNNRWSDELKKNIAEIYIYIYIYMYIYNIYIYIYIYIYREREREFLVEPLLEGEDCSRLFCCRRSSGLEPLATSVEG